MNTDDPVSSPRLQVPQLGLAAGERAPLLEASPVRQLRVTPDIQQQTEAQSARLCTSQLLSATTAAVTAAPREIKSFHPRFQNVELVLVVRSGACTCRHMQVMGRDATRAYSMTDTSDKDEHDRDMTGSNLVARTGLSPNTCFTACRNTSS